MKPIATILILLLLAVPAFADPASEAAQADLILKQQVVIAQQAAMIDQLKAKLAVYEAQFGVLPTVATSTAPQIIYVQVPTNQFAAGGCGQAFSAGGCGQAFSAGGCSSFGVDAGGCGQSASNGSCGSVGAGSGNSGRWYPGKFLSKLRGGAGGCGG